MAFSSSAAASSSQDASSGAASSASTIAASTKASSSSAASPTLTDSADTRPTCPGDNGKTFTTAAGTFVIECYVDRFNNDLGPASSNPTDYAGCLNACAATSGCKAVSYVPNGACYLKNGIGAPSTNIGIWGASLVSGASSTGPGAASMASSAATSSASTSTLASTTSTGPVATSSVVCPGSDGQTISTQAGTFVVECGIDRAGGDMANSPVYPGSYVGCVAACASRDSCVDVSYVQNGPCYLKSIAGTPNPNANIIGGRLITVTSSSSSVASSSVAATSLAATSGPAAPVQTVTVTTTISGTGYQCACTPSGGLGSGTASSATASATSGAQLNCPASDGSIFTSSCGATYRIECYSDRYGDDIPGGTSYTNTLDECIADCDKTNGCVDVSYIRGSPGPCYKKSSVAAIQRNDNVFGALQLTGCTSSIKLKLHRKRVVRSPTTPKKIIHKRGVFGPDFTYTQGTTTVTQTTTSTSVHNTTV
ncbi:uncharacterized protein M421DRAFT_58497 [Didymella exigua CBS 183.55]|uniref:Apple domain-containing protein n=1 Tax=Didymella exigua CBS 183.55 TaxID=1150837 RepID=A0A6A5RT47_9PLEO|nr:uncharacterized protein M421DRAFT_58497 [Didymella exigua CBS 183.55]KAF1930294.1 hypothetical protein M421DRAFT_58497 [Didymella exigua CBS 183.55]